MRLGESPLEEVDILIGTPQRIRHFVRLPQRSVFISDCLVAVETNFGWLVEGRSDHGVKTERQSFVVATSEYQCLCQQVGLLLRDPLSSRNDCDLSVEQWIQKMLTRITYDPKEKRWSVPLPWYNTDRPQNNRAAVYKATQHQVRRAEERGLKKLYDAAISVYTDGQFAEQVFDNPPDAYYIPHHHVMKPGSTTAVRVVMNASFARRDQKSLNDCLFKGVSEQNNLFGLLIRWRTNAYAVTADLKQAFLQIRIHPEDRRYLRFFWGTDSEHLSTYQMKSVMFGAAPSPAQLYLVLRKIFESAPETEVHRLHESIYMDDVFYLGPDLATIQRLIEVSSRVLKAASFPLHKWACPEWIQREGLLVENHQEVAGCLGVRWGMEGDHCCLKPPSADVRQFTRRGIAQVIGRLHDVLGLLGPFSTRLKLLMKDTLTGTRGWDTPVEEAVQDAAKDVFAEFSLVEQLSLPRVIRSSEDFELIGFGDASRLAYGAAVYLWERSSQQMNLLASRSRVVSEKRTMPELELCAAVLLVDLAVSVSSYLPPAKRTRFFSDSMITLGRIRQSTPNRYAQYVSNRLSKIKEKTQPDQWHFVPTEQNPADALSRGLSLAELLKHSLWFHGPDPLQLKDLDSPQLYSISSKPIVPLSKSESLLLDKKTLSLGYDGVIRFLTSYYEAMERNTGLIARENAGLEQKLSAAQLAVAAAWRLFQRVAFRDEVNLLRAGKPLPSTSKLGKLNVFLDAQKVMRLDRRLKEAPLDYEAKYPIVAVDHPFVRGFLERFHSMTMAHSSHHRTLVEVNNMLYLPRCSDILRSVLDGCLRCRFLHGKPFTAPPAPLPADRVNNEENLPFNHVGVDLFGPLITRGAKAQYGMIFVCCNTRAVHLELIPSRNATCILRAFARFIARRGTPRVVRSDNEKGFHKVESPLKEICEDFVKCRRQLLEKYSFEWLFQPADSPFWGGFFERLIGVVKKTLANWPLSRRYTPEELSTILCEVEAIVNSRPLLPGTLTTSPLTPAHFLIGRSFTFVPPLRMKEKPVDPFLINYATICEERDKLWTRLRKEYLTSLRQFHRHGGKTREPEIGELVLLVGSCKREDWDWGRVQSLMRGPDGIVRAASLLMPNGNIWERPVQSLIPLESSARRGECGAATSAAVPSSTDGSRANALEADQPSIGSMIE
ncbi:hypothetical protein TYRP_003336 [Tyrophagus putrescentiae]|nr:hypothetical protein TYRP_003336 [Tyrophagus putrescentiae]